MAKADFTSAFCRLNDLRAVSTVGSTILQHVAYFELVQRESQKRLRYLPVDPSKAQLLNAAPKDA